MGMTDGLDYDKVKPALAGYLVDGKVEYNEVIATIVDLIQRDYIFYEADKLAIAKAPDTRLMFYERELMGEIFGEEYLYDLKGGIDKYVDYNLIIALIKLDLVRLGLGYYHSGSKSVKDSLVVPNRYSTKEYLTQKLPQQLRESPLLILLIVFSIIGLCIFVLSVWVSPLMAVCVLPIALAPVLILFALLASIALALLSSEIVKLSNVVIAMTDEGMRIKEQCTLLNENIVQNPQTKDLNLSREMLPYQIAFGRNTIWNERLAKLTNITPYKFPPMRTINYTWDSSWISFDLSEEKHTIVKFNEDGYMDIHLSKSGSEYPSPGSITEGSLLLSDEGQNPPRVSVQDGEWFFEGKAIVNDDKIIVTSEKPIAKFYYTYRSKEKEVKLFASFFEDLTDMDIILLMAYKLASFHNMNKAMIKITSGMNKKRYGR
jgi:hypothetical protein